MNEPEKTKKFTVAATGRLFVRLLELAILLFSFLGWLAGAALIAIGVFHLHEDSERSFALGAFGAVMTIPFLTILLAWLMSRRLIAMNRMQKQMRDDLDELLRRTER